MDTSMNFVNSKLKELAMAVKKSQEEMRIIEESRLKAEIRSLKNQLLEKDKIIQEKCIENEELTMELEDLIEENEDLKFKQKQMKTVYKDMKFDVHVRQNQVRRAKIENKNLKESIARIKMFSLSAEQKSMEYEEKLKNKVLELSSKIERFEMLNAEMSSFDSDFFSTDDRRRFNSTEPPESFDYKANFDEFSTINYDASCEYSKDGKLQKSSEKGMNKKFLKRVELDTAMIFCNVLAETDSYSDGNDAKSGSIKMKNKRNPKVFKKPKVHYKKVTTFACY